VSAALLLPLLVFAVSFAHDQMRCRVTGARLPAPSLVAARTAPVLAPIAGYLQAAALTPRPPTGPPLRLVKQSFLI